MDGAPPPVMKPKGICTFYTFKKLLEKPPSNKYSGIKVNMRKLVETYNEYKGLGPNISYTVATFPTVSRNDFRTWQTLKGDFFAEALNGKWAEYIDTYREERRYKYNNSQAYKEGDPGYLSDTEEAKEIANENKGAAPNGNPVPNPVFANLAPKLIRFYEQYASYTLCRSKTAPSDKCCKAMIVLPRRKIRQCRNMHLRDKEFCHPHICQIDGVDETSMLTTTSWEQITKYHKNRLTDCDARFEREKNLYCNSEEMGGSLPIPQAPDKTKLNLNQIKDVEDCNEDLVTFKNEKDEVTNALKNRFRQLEYEILDKPPLDRLKIMQKTNEMMKGYKSGILNLVDINLSKLFQTIEKQRTSDDSDAVIADLHKLFESESQPCTMSDEERKFRLSCASNQMEDDAA
jgi:hypothetical protein